MDNYIFDFKYKQENTAGSKAKSDILFFLQEEGFKKINFPILNNRILRGLSAKILAKLAVGKIKSGSIVFQYPLYHKRISRYILNELDKNKAKKIVIIHDLESLRLNIADLNAVSTEVEFLNRFDQVISHNNKMTAWLIDHGLKIPVKNLNIFDYNNPTPLGENNLSDGIVFAGNLVKSVFLSKLDIETPMDVMGPNPLKKFPRNINYCGVFTPEEVPEHLKRKFGLVWDGNSTKTCTGLYGHYMKYNNPHKVSLYLSSGIPVIIWKKAALANFVTENGCGITVDDLSNIDNVLATISDVRYKEMQVNTLKIAEKMRTGFYIKKVLNNN